MYYENMKDVLVSFLVKDNRVLISAIRNDGKEYVALLAYPQFISQPDILSVYIYHVIEEVLSNKEEEY
jgi:hypothetical protein